MNTSFGNEVIDQLYRLRNEANRELNRGPGKGQWSTQWFRRRAIDIILDAVDPF